jgi:anti-sigma B factor antagonist
VSTSDPTIFKLTGEVDFLGRDALHGALEELISHETVILDFSELDYMDSSGISQVLLLLRARTKAGRSAPRVVQGPKVSRIFEIAGIATLVPLFDSVDQARSGRD